MRRWLVVLIAAIAPAASAQPASAFDGTWGVIFSCPATSGGTAGYTRRFVASVRGGSLQGQVGVAGEAGFLALDGSIQPDGAALLTGHGLTGDPNYVVGRSSPATPYSFHMQARFAGSSGTGSRVEVRRCDAVFSKQ